jgi:hypothetical protein
MNYVLDQRWVDSSLTGHVLSDRPCARGIVYAAPRWFTVAQVAANFPKHPFVETLDPEHLSYYNFRQKMPTAGCPVVVFSEKSHWRDSGWVGVSILESEEFLIDGHRDRPVIVGRGWYTGQSSDD